MATTASKDAYHKVNIIKFLVEIFVWTISSIICVGWILGVVLYSSGFSSPLALLIWIVFACCCIVSTIIVAVEKTREATSDPEKLRYFNFSVLIVCTLISISVPLFIGTAEITSTETKTEAIPSPTKYETAPSLFLGGKTLQGEDGEKEISYKIVKRFVNGEIISKEKTNEKITKTPKETIVYRGTWSNLAPSSNNDDVYNDDDYDDEEYGAICRDGTRSYSTGRGTCSWHGGVAYWL